MHYIFFLNIRLLVKYSKNVAFLFLKNLENGLIGGNCGSIVKK